MGKSPGKWIKSILLGRKASNSSLSMGRELSRSASEKPARVSSKELIPTTTIDTPLISDLVPTVSDRIDNSRFEKGEAAALASEGQVSPLSKIDMNKPSDTGLSEGSEKIMLEQATIIVQTSFRGYQARNGFQTLKGAIRLQAAIRGHLVRRQAVATLVCIQGIVRFQAITRGYMVRQARVGNGVCRKQHLVVKDASNQDPCKISNTLLKNALINELLASSQTTMPLRLQCGAGDSNSAWSWLHRWSTSRVWAPNSRHKETDHSKLQTVERRVPSASVQNGANHANAKTEKPKLLGRKLSSQSVKSAQEHTQLGQSKVKHGLRKNQKPIGEISNEEVDVKKPKGHRRKLSNSLMKDLVEPGAKNVACQLSSHLSPEEPQNLSYNKNQDILHAETDFENVHICSDNYKSSQITSFPAKCDQNATPGSLTRAPSYLSTTASSLAKVKLQVSPRFGHDVIAENGLTRRYSLPSSMSGKLVSSPRVNRLVQSNGKEGIKIDRSLSSSRQIAVADKVNHVDRKR